MRYNEPLENVYTYMVIAGIEVVYAKIIRPIVLLSSFLKLVPSIVLLIYGLGISLLSILFCIQMGLIIIRLTFFFGIFSLHKELSV